MAKPLNVPIASLRPVGRPKKQPPEDAAQRVQEYAADGFSLVGIARRFGTTFETLKQWMAEDVALKEAFDQGRDEQEHAIANKLYRTAMEGEGRDATLAQMFLLKAKFGWREGERQEPSSRISITFNLPGAMSREDFLKTVVSDERDS